MMEKMNLSAFLNRIVTRTKQFVLFSKKVLLGVLKRSFFTTKQFVLFSLSYFPDNQVRGSCLSRHI